MNNINFEDRANTYKSLMELARERLKETQEELDKLKYGRWIPVEEDIYFEYNERRYHISNDGTEIKREDADVPLIELPENLRFAYYKNDQVEYGDLSKGKLIQIIENLLKMNSELQIRVLELESQLT